MADRAFAIRRAYEVMSMMKKDDNAPIEIEGLDQSMVDKAVEAVVALINATLGSKTKSRFVEAARLCQIGQQLMRTQAKSVKDFAMLEVEADDDEDVADDAPAANRFLDLVRRNDGSTRDARLSALALQPAAQVAREVGAAEIATNEATELEKLITLRDRLPEEQRGAILSRIQTLITSLETRNNAQLQMTPEPTPASTAQPQVANGVGHAIEEGGGVAAG